MAPKAKPKARAFKPPEKPTSLNQVDFPKPFTRPSSRLDKFLSTLVKGKVYITHIDRKPKDFKRKIFMVPLIMNILIVTGIIWRIRNIGPYYMKIGGSLMGRPNETTVDAHNMPLEDSSREILNRTTTFMTDLLLYIFVWPWPRDFFSGRRVGNPLFWRIGVGFRAWYGWCR